MGPEPAGETDITAALVRTAFIVSFYVTPYVLGASQAVSSRPVALVQATMVVSAVFNLVVLLSWLRQQPLGLTRPLALLVDLLIVTAAIETFKDVVSTDQLVAIYYLVIMMAAVWYRRAGAALTALTASALYGIVCLGQPPGLPALWFGGAPAMLIIGIVASYIMAARDTEGRVRFRLEHEMALARTLQDAMLPTEAPRVPGLDTAFLFQPARVVGGDMYDAVATAPGKLLVCIGDMAGKSVYGLFHLSLVHSHMHAAVDQGLPPEEIAETINHNVYDALQPHSFAAMFFAELDTQARTLSFVNCGHLPPALIRAAGGPPEELLSGGIVIGGKHHPGYKARQISMGRR